MHFFGEGGKGEAQALGHLKIDLCRKAFISPLTPVSLRSCGVRQKNKCAGYIGLVRAIYESGQGIVLVERTVRAYRWPRINAG